MLDFQIKETNTMADLNITIGDLKEMIGIAVATAIMESRKPNPPTADEIAATQMAQEHRADMAADVTRSRENKLAMQKICSHEHAAREGGGTHCVWVREEDPASPGYIYCQSCEGKVRPNGGYEGTKRGDRNAIYDTALFNRLFQACGPMGMMG